MFLNNSRNGKLYSILRFSSLIIQFNYDFYVTTIALIKNICHVRVFVFADGKYHAMHTGELLVHNLESSDQFSSYTCQMMHTLTRKVTTSSPANIVVHGKTNPNINYGISFYKYFPWIHLYFFFFLRVYQHFVS